MARPKAKRRLSDIDFSSDGCHIALVSKEQGGPASGHDYALVMKSTKQFSAEFIEKAQRVKVTMELDDFLQRFFHLYEDDALVLASMMGYVETDDEDEGVYEGMSFWEWRKEQNPDVDVWSLPEPTAAEYQDYVATRMQGVELLKSLVSAESLPDALSKLTEDEYLSVLRDQERVETAIAKAEKAKTEPKTKKVIAKKVEKPQQTETVIKTVKETNMPGEQKTVAQVEVEVVEKAQLTELQKAFEAQKEMLEKAQALVATFEAEKKEALEKARFAALEGAVKDKAKAEVIFKAVKSVESQEEFDAVVKALSELTAQVETSELFVEKGVSGEGEGSKAEESAVAKLLKARQPK